MKKKHKLILKAKVTKQITEYYELDCTGMDMDDVKSEMGIAYVEDRSNWEYVDSKTDHSAIDTELVIQ